MFICYTDCQDYSMTTNIIGGQKLKLQPSLPSAAMNGCMLIFCSNVHYVRVRTPRPSASQPPGRTALWWRQMIQWAAGKPTHLQGPLTRKAVTINVLAKMQIPHEICVRVLYYERQHGKPQQRKVLAADVQQCYPLLNEQYVEASPHFWNNENQQRLQGFLISSHREKQLLQLFPSFKLSNFVPNWESCLEGSLLNLVIITIFSNVSETFS